MKPPSIVLALRFARKVTSTVFAGITEPRGKASKNFSPGQGGESTAKTETKKTKVPDLTSKDNSKVTACGSIIPGNTTVVRSRLST